MNTSAKKRDSHQALLEFVEVGKLILNTNHETHYGRRLPGFRGFQPGFMPLKPAKLCVIGCYPSLGAGLQGTPARRREEDTLAEWKDTGSLQAYKNAYSTFLSDFVDWSIFKKYVHPVLKQASVEPDEIAWVDVIKAPLQAKSPSSLVKDLAPKDLAWLDQQIELIHCSSVASMLEKVSNMPCLIETKQAENLIRDSQDFYLRLLLMNAEVQAQTHGQTTEQILAESKLVGTRLRARITYATER